MKLLRLSLLYVIIIMLIGCGKEDQQSVIPGYIKPGDFRPKGIIGMPDFPLVAPKSYRLTDPTFTGGDGTCSGEECLSVYALWSTDNVPVEGIAIKDVDTAESQLLMKLTRVKGADWQVRLTYKGIGYKNNLVPVGSMDLSFCSTTIPTLPAYDPDSAVTGDEFNASETFLVKATLTVITRVDLTSNDGSRTVSLMPGDEIVAHAHSAIASNHCP